MYVWTLQTDERELSIHRTKMIHWFLQIPPLTEAMLAWLQYARDDPYRNSTGDASCAILHHQSKALTLLQLRLSQPSSVLDEATLWTIVALLVLNQQLEDWVSFRVNMNGLRKVVALRGGMSTLATQNHRASSAVRNLESLYVSHQYPDTHALARQPPLQEHRFTKPQGLLVSLPCLPAGFHHLANSHQLSSLAIARLEECIYWLREHRVTMKNAHTSNMHRAQLTMSLLELLRNSEIQDADLIMGVGMLAVLSAQAQDSDNQGQCLLRSAISELVVRLKSTAAAQSKRMVEEHLLWAAFAV